jgi:hypothetical protein
MHQCISRISCLSEDEPTMGSFLLFDHGPSLCALLKNYAVLLVSCNVAFVLFE